MGRIIKNHSTHIEGLIDRLTIISRNESIKSITPGIIKRVKSNSEKLILRITKETQGGFKLIARKGRMAQEVYIITKLSKTTLEQHLNSVLEKR